MAAPSKKARREDSLIDEIIKDLQSRHAELSSATDVHQYLQWLTVEARVRVYLRFDILSVLSSDTGELKTILSIIYTLLVHTSDKKSVIFCEPGLHSQDLIYGILTIMKLAPVLHAIGLLNFGIPEGEDLLCQIHNVGFPLRELTLGTLMGRGAENKSSVVYFWMRLMTLDTLEILKLDGYFICKDHFDRDGIIGIEQAINYFKRTKVRDIKFGGVYVCLDEIGNPSDYASFLSQIVAAIVLNPRVYNFSVGYVMYAHTTYDNHEPLRAIVAHAIEMIDARRRAAEKMMQEFCTARVYDSTCLFDNDYLPLDLFRVIMKNFEEEIGRNRE